MNKIRLYRIFFYLNGVFIEQIFKTVNRTDQFATIEHMRGVSLLLILLDFFFHEPRNHQNVHFCILITQLPSDIESN